MRNHPYGLEIYLVNVKTMRTIAQIFVAFLEKLNFIAQEWRVQTPIFECSQMVVMKRR